jgi:hypothetical protein
MRQMMFKGGTFGRRLRLFSSVQVTDEVAFTISDNPIAKYEIMHSATHVDGINLDETKARQHRINAYCGRIEHHGPAVESARI